ncbi:AbrB/MazE/SpoVT family DNA-binding domain-containing protein [Iamia sp.]|uniref:AbrB/MazE/SpoVT family DNA-binding domain-containing protein n=1 Tax=Iamia sp. TaxID=2722710 RepID=UPI002BDF204A|nr:AbrB/MazE/SpoVT family DNA-binding domain-containing protein [Iamia sp.]HXH56770.1 AbrB/MazE/SpoVT family DNA-binding domain-containing protein [Iamia sp.]
MEASIDSVGRIVIPKGLRDALGLVSGSSVDLSLYGSGLQLVPSGRTARLVESDGVLVAESDIAIDDDTVLGLIDAGRR